MKSDRTLPALEPELVTSIPQLIVAFLPLQCRPFNVLARSLYTFLYLSHVDILIFLA
jgi:hypothetical protein